MEAYSESYGLQSLHVTMYNSPTLLCSMESLGVTSSINWIEVSYRSRAAKITSNAHALYISLLAQTWNSKISQNSPMINSLSLLSRVHNRERNYELLLLCIYSSWQASYTIIIQSNMFTVNQYTYVFYQNWHLSQYWSIELS